MAESGLGYQMHRSFGELDRKRGIQAVELRLVDEEDVRRLAVTEIRVPSHLKNHAPVAGGLNDLTLGTFNSDFRCGTCLHGLDKCPGHWGRYGLSTWAYHPGFLSRTVKILRTLCFWCSRVLADKKSDRFRSLPSKGSRRFDAIHRRISGMVMHACPHCSGPIPRYKCDRRIFVDATFEDDAVFSCEDEREYASRPFTAEEARRIMSNATAEDLEWLGFTPSKSHPKSLVFRSLLIPPNPMRPPMRTSSSSRAHGQDDITLKLADIIRADQVLARRISSPGWERSQELTDFVCELTVYMDRETADIMEASSRKHFRVGANRVLNTVPTRLKGKNGRLRRTVIGKRTEFCARAVIRPAAFLKPWEVLVPCTFKLTFPEMVNDSNRAFLERCCGFGPNDVRGAVEIELKDGQRVDLAFRRPSERVPLEVGWIVHRRVMGKREKAEVMRMIGVAGAREEDFEGDFLIVNRQPTLFKNGIMCHEAVINPDPRDMTFGIPPQMTTSYNADFDGDEMNITISQMTAARAECKDLMHVRRNFRGAQNGEPVPCFIQDALLGLFMLTRKGTFLSREDVFQLVMVADVDPARIPPPAVLRPARLWTGKQVFSMLLPQTYTNRWGKEAAAMDVFDMKAAAVLGGQLIYGTLSKKVMGKDPHGLPRTLAQDFGDDVAMDFMHAAHAVAISFVTSHGFTITAEDVQLQEDKAAEVRDEIRSVMAAYRGFFSEGVLRTAPQWTRRLCSGRVLEDTLGTVAAIVSTKDVHDRNNIETLNKSGAKGSDTHTAQMRGAIGQVHVGEEGPPRVKGDDRALPCYQRRDASAVAQGFIDACYGGGLSMPQWFFHTMAGRVGLVDTALGTSIIGYLQRCLVKNQEGVATAYDNTVRNSNGAIMDTYYGHNHLDPEAAEQVRVPWLDGALVRETFSAEGGEGGEEARQERERAEEYVRAFCRNRVALALAMQHPEIFPYTHVPIDVERLLRALPLSSSPPSPSFCRRMRDELRRDVVAAMRRNEEPCYEYLAVYDYWLSWHVLRRYDARDVAELFRKVHRATFAAIIPAGNPTGINSAMSIGAPSTQMTLNTFHLPGVLSKQVTMGVPRLKEIINVQEKMQTPTVTVYFPSAREEAWVEAYAKRLHACVLSDIVRSSSATIVREPRLTSTVVDEDAYIYELARMTGEMLRCSPSPGLSLRFSLDRDKCEDFGVRVSHVADVIRSMVGQSCVVVASTDSCIAWTVRVHFAAHFDHAAAQLWSAKANRSAKDAERAAARERELVIAAIAGRGGGGGAGREEDEGAYYQVMIELRQFLMDHVLLKGVEGVTAVTRRATKTPQLSADGLSHRFADEWVLDVRGKVFRDILTLPEVDPRRTLSNNIKEVYDVLGILGARSVIFQELYAVMREGGIGICPSHLITITSTLTHSGTLTAFTRSGMVAGNQGVLERMSFEQTYDVCKNGALFAEAEDITGVTPPIMLGKLPVVGTGVVSLVGEDGKPLPFGHELREAGEAGQRSAREEVDIAGVVQAQDAEGRMFSLPVDVDGLLPPLGSGEEAPNFLDLDAVGGEEDLPPPLELLMETLAMRRRELEARGEEASAAGKKAAPKAKRTRSQRSKPPPPRTNSAAGVVVVNSSVFRTDADNAPPAFRIVSAQTVKVPSQAAAAHHQYPCVAFSIVGARML